MKSLLIALIVVVSAASASAQKVRVSADANFNLAKYKTYAWDRGVPANNPLIEQNIIATVDQALAAKGLTKVTTNPDLVVISMAAINADLQMYMPRWSNNVGSPTWYGMAVGSQMATITKGMLVVDVADASTKESVWRGGSNETLSHGPTGDFAKDARSVDKKVKKAIEKMFKQFPRPS
jgi:hypothetical protein